MANDSAIEDYPLSSPHSLLSTHGTGTQASSPILSSSITNTTAASLATSIPESFEMGEAVKPAESTVPPDLFKQLNEIDGYTFDESKPPFHSSYDNWHVFGVRHGSRAKKKSKESNPLFSPPIRESAFSTIANDNEEDIPVVARISIHTLRLEREFHIVNLLTKNSDPDCQRVVRPFDLIYLPNSGLIVSIFQSPGRDYQTGIVNLINTTASEPIPLPSFLDFAIGASECLELLSSENIVHGEIRGDAFHFNRETGVVKLINFGSGPRSFDHGLNNATWSNVSKQAGIIDKLFFISPEQTGRMPAPPDARTDIYSTGILFYTLLTNQLVFEVGSPMEVVQSVLTRRVPLAHTRRVDVPETLSHIIQKMTAKQIDERYHSASGLKYDLIQVQKHLGNPEALKGFRLGTKDITSIFTLPATMVGRTVEQNEIVQVIERAARVRDQKIRKLGQLIDSSSETSSIDGDSESSFSKSKACDVIAISGSGGMGKSSLVTNVLVEARRRGYFATAKFDQSHKTPFAPVLRALNSIFEQVLTESEVIVEDFKTQVLNAFIKQSLPLHRMKVDLPALEYILNATPHSNLGIEMPEPRQVTTVRRGQSNRTSPPLKDTQGKTVDLKISSVSIDVLRILAQNKFVCIWLDDLQFADDESLQLLASIVAANIRVCLILTYREGEIQAPRLAEIINPEKANVTSVVLGPLNEEAIIEYCKLALNQERNGVIPLVGTIQAKSGGNPFYMREMLSMLHRRGLLVFNRFNHRWEYDMDHIFKALEVDSPADMANNRFIVRRLQELPYDTRVFLAWSSLLGTVFSFRQVKSLVGSDEKRKAHAASSPNYRKADIVNGLQTAIQACLIVATDEEDLFRFSHDRYLQAAADLAAAEDRARMHLNIARLLMEEDSATDSTSLKDYAMCEHICEATDLLREQFPVRAPFRSTIIAAAKDAAQNSAYGIASRFYLNAISLLQENPWDDCQQDVDYHETLKLYPRAARALWHIGKNDQALELLDVVFKNARKPEETAKARMLCARILREEGQHLAATESFLKCLEVLSINFDRNPTWEATDRKFRKLLEELKHPSLNPRLHQMRPVTKRENIIGQALFEAVTTSYWADTLQFYGLVVLMVEILVRDGAYPQAGSGLTCFASIAARRFNLVHFACELGDVAHNLIQMSEDQLQTARGVIMHCMSIKHLQAPIPAELAELEACASKVMRLGDKVEGAIALALTASLKLSCANDLHDVLAYCTSAFDQMPKWIECTEGMAIIYGVSQFVHALMGDNWTDEARLCMSNPSFDSDRYARSLKAKGKTTAYGSYIAYRTAAYYFFGHFKEAAEDASECLDVSDKLLCTRQIRHIILFHALSRAEILRTDPPQSIREQYIRELREDLSLIEEWMIVSRVNYYAWARMLAAELYDVTRDFDNAAIAYEEAIDHAQTHGFCLAEAVSSELAAKSYYRRGLKRVACAFYQEAIAGYHRLGAVGKANQLRDGFGRNLRRLQRTALVDQGCQTDTILRELLQASIHEESRAVIGPQGQGSGPPTRDYARRTESFTSDSDDNRPIGLDSNNIHIVLDALDLNSIIKSSQLIASEVKMDDLLKRMCEIVLDSAGSQADLAAIIVKDEEADQFVVSAMGGPDFGAQSLKPGVKIEAKENEISKPVIFYVLRTKKPLFLRNLVLDERFSNPNKAWLEKNPASKSIIALPIQHESLLGVLYVEGTVDALTDRNLLVLEYLTSQIGISIKNALLFQRIGKISIANHALIESQKEALANAKSSEMKAKMATEEAIRMMKLKEDASRAKSEFLANVSHELRTPLSGVIGLTELLNETPMTAAQQNLSDSIRLCADTLLTVINDILDFSKIEAGKMKLSIGEFNVADCIRDVIRALTMANKGKKAIMPGLSIAMVNNAVAKQNLVNVIEQIDLPLDRLVYGDKSRLHQVLMNILSNSFKFCNEGSITVRAKVDGETEDDLQILVTVADTGIGIDDYTIRLLFTPFSQADTSTARRYGGTGLGLSICKHLVEMMGGKIWLESTVGKGTTVFFTVKFKKARLISEALASGGSSNSLSSLVHTASTPNSPTGSNEKIFTLNPTPVAMSGPTPQPHRPGQLRILVAEDNPVNQRIAVSFVEKIGLSVKAVNNGVEALEALKSQAAKGEPFDLVLMDVQMPIMDGYEATKMLRMDENQVVRDVTVIAMTASAIQGDKEKCLQVGMNDYLAKPVRSETLREKLSCYLTWEPPAPRPDPEPLPSPTSRKVDRASSPLQSPSSVVEEDSQFNEGSFSEASTLSGHGGPPSTPVHFKTSGTQTNVVEMVDSGTDAFDFDSEEAVVVPMVNGCGSNSTDKVDGVEKFVQVEGEEYSEKGSKEDPLRSPEQKPREYPDEDPGGPGQK